MLERHGPIPLYYQLELRLREAIESGQYRPGERLPTEQELQRLYGVSRVTVRTTLQRLEADGLVTSHRGRGTFVTAQAGDCGRIERHTARLLAFEEDIRRAGLQPRVDVLVVERCPVPGRMALLLGLAEGEEVVHLRRLGWAGSDPLWVESRYFHPTIGDRLREQDLTSTSITALVQGVIGVPVASTRLRLSAGAATREQAKLLAISPGDPVLINEFAVSDSQRRPVEATRAVFRADRYAFTVEIPAVPEAGEVAGAGVVTAPERFGGGVDER